MKTAQLVAKWADFVVTRSSFGFRCSRTGSGKHRRCGHLHGMCVFMCAALPHARFLVFSQFCVSLDSTVFFCVPAHHVCVVTELGVLPKSPYKIVGIYTFAVFAIALFQCTLV